jgi:acyl-CoA thioester hydrolase
MYTHELKFRVRYGETDCMGIVYHANYINYYEIARTEMLRASGNYSYREMENEGVLMPVVEVQSRYILPAYYDELITVRTTIREMPTARIRFHYEIFNEKNELINSGLVVLGFMNSKTRRPCRPPAKLIEALKEVIQ